MVAGVVVTSVLGLVALIAMLMTFKARCVEQTRNGTTISKVHEALQKVPSVSAPGNLAPEERLRKAIAGRAAARFQVQEEHYSNALHQSTSYFYLSLIVGLLGFFFLMTGVGLAFSHAFPHSIQVGAVIGVTGLLTDVAATLVFNQAERAKKAAQDNLSSIAQAAERDENYIMAFVYASRIEEASVRDRINAAIARSLVTAAVGPAIAPKDDEKDDEKGSGLSLP